MSYSILFQSSPALKDRCNEEERKTLRPIILVSILTGLERPVQPRIVAAAFAAVEFQSSPALKDRCNLLCPAQVTHERVFQSSPALKDRCNELKDVPLVPLGGFNPHRP